MAAKEKKVINTQKNKNGSFLSEFSLDKYIPLKYQTPLLLLITLLIFLLFYSPLYFGGKTFQSGDIITSKSMTNYVKNHQDGYTLWNPYIFTGMPAYALAVGYKWFNLIYVVTNSVRDIFSAPFAIEYAMWTFYLVALAFTMFAFIMNRTKDRLISLFSALSVSFSTGLVVFLYIGHVTKLTAIFVFPLLLLFLLNFQKKIRFVDVMLLFFFMPVMFLGWHVQIIFYIFFAVLIYFLYYFAHAAKLKDKFLAIQLVKSGFIFIAAVLIGLLTLSDNFTQIWEYTPYSTRGTESILDVQLAAASKTETNLYEYNTNWSFSPGEVLTWIVPSYYGFGKSVYNGPLTNNTDVEVNTYFGQMPFVDVAMYMGVIVFLLAVFSVIINWKDPFIRYLTILIIISTFISFGRTLPFLYDLMYHYFPFFDKFRVPSMMLVLVQLSLPILAGLGIAKIIALKKEGNKKYDNLLRNIFIGAAVIFILTIILGSPIKDWFISRAVDTGEKGTRLQQLHDYMSEMFLSDLRLAFFFALATFGLIYAYIKSSLSKDLMIASIVVLSLFDLFRINHRGETYVEYSDIEKQFVKPEYVTALESLNDRTTYRIINLKKEGIGNISQNSNYNAYFSIQDLYGYSGIKPRAFEDYMEVLGTPANPTLWRMTNTKYIILDTPMNYQGFSLVYSGNKTYVYRNDNALPRAYFTDKVQKASAIEILNKVKNNEFDPKQIAFVEDADIKVDVPDTTVSVEIEKYADEKITLSVNASGNNFLFLSDTYYGKPFEYKIPVLNIPIFSANKWQAFIDGKETEIYKANHNFRGIVVPKGNHKVEFVYAPASFEVSKNISLAVSSLIIIGLLLSLGMEIKKKQVERLDAN